MENRLVSRLGISLVLTFVTVASQSLSASDLPALRVWVIDTAHIDEKTLSDALKTTARIFTSAGLRMIWLSCPARAGRSGNSARCLAEDSGLLVLRIVSRPAGGFVDQDALGFAVATRENATYATVFRDRVLAALDPAGPCTESVLLGHVIAHEIGHLLLGTTAHARAGLMAGRWHAADLNHAASGWLQFSPSEAARMSAEATRRASDLDASGTNRPDHHFSHRPDHSVVGVMKANLQRKDLRAAERRTNFLINPAWRVTLSGR